MLNVLLIIAFTGAVIVSAVFAGVMFLQGVRSALDTQITRQRLLDAATRVQAQARYVGGYYALPQGAAGSSPYAYNQVPSWISSKAISASGVPFEYCPYASANNGGTSSTVTMGSTTTYNVKYTSNASSISQPYVTDNNGTSLPAGAPSGTMALLVAASPGKYYPPDCSSVSAASDGTPIVSGGMVVAVQDNYFNKMQTATTATELRFYIGAGGGADGSAATGDGSGRDANNLATLSSVITLIDYAQPAEATIIFPSAGGSFTITGSSALSYGGRIYLNGTAASYWSTNVTLANETIDEFSMLGVHDIRLDDSGTLTVQGEMQVYSAVISPSTSFLISGGMVTADSGSVILTGAVNVDGGGELDIDGSGIFFDWMNNRGIKILNGTLAFGNGYSSTITAESANIVPIFIGAGGIMSMIGTNLSFVAGAGTAAGGIVVDPGGTLVATNSSQLLMNVSSYGIYDHGNVIMQPQTSMTFNTSTPGYGILLASGGRLTATQAGSGQSDLIGNHSTATSTWPSTAALYDNGGSSITESFGTNTAQLNSPTACWAARAGTNLFTDSPSGTVTGHKTTPAGSTGSKWLLLYNQTNWNCNL